MRALFFVLFSCFTVPAFAQSSLGVTGAVFTLGNVEDEGGDYRRDASARVDAAITDVHGFQADLRFSDALGGVVGTTVAHIYMTPKTGQKYGLFAALSDVDGRSMLYGSLGAEGMFSLGESTAVELRAGMGWADVGGLDYVFAGLSVAQGLTSAVELELSLDATEIDEAGLSAVALDLGVTARYSPQGSPWGAYAGVTRSELAGASAPGATRIGAGLTLELGNAGGTDPHTRPFRTPDPLAQLLRRGLW